MPGKSSKSAWSKFVAPVCIVVLLLSVGVGFGMWMGEFSFVTSLYWMTQIITTIGYGDLDYTAHSISREDIMHLKLFVSFYALLVLIFVAYFMNLATQNICQYKVDALRAALRHSSGGAWPRGTCHLLISTARFAFVVAFGTVFYRKVEHCTCSYGVSAVEGCTDDSMPGGSYETCLKTGGFVKSWIECFYMSVITLTTIGFGDNSPRTWIGRSVGVAWMLAGVTVTVMWIEAMSKFFFEYNEKIELNASDIDEQLFNEIDTNNNNRISRAEYLKFLLLKNDLVSAEALRDIDEAFDRLRGEDRDVSLDAIRQCKLAEKNEESGSSTEDSDAPFVGTYSPMRGS